MSNQPLRIGTLQDCKQWVAGLALTNAQQVHGALLAQLKLLAAAPLAPEARLEILEALRAALLFVQGERAKRLFNPLVPLEPPLAELWTQIDGLWRELLAAYESCTGAAASHRALVFQRALDCVGRSMLEYNRAYRAVPGALWQHLHRLFAAAEAAGCAALAVPDLAGEGLPDESCAAAYARVVLAQHSTTDALNAAQLGAVDLWLHRWSPLAVVSAAPPAAADGALGVVLDAGAGARRAADLQPAPNVRYLDMARLGALLVQLLAALRNGKTPAELALGSALRAPACESLLLLLANQWCGMGQGRSEERSPAAMKVQVSTSIAAMHFHLTGRAFRQPGARLSAREEADMQMFGRVSERTEQSLLSQRSGALETWEIVNHSRSGMLGMCRSPDGATRVCHNQLLGLRTANGRTFYLGIVQRMQTDEAGALSIGLRVIPGAPQAIAARVPGAVVADGKAYDRALLMPADEARKVPASVIMAPGVFQAQRPLDLYAEASRPVRLTAVLDRGVNFERMTFVEG